MTVKVKRKTIFQKVLKQHRIPYKEEKRRKIGKLRQVWKLHTTVRNKKSQQFSLLFIFFLKNLTAIIHKWETRYLLHLTSALNILWTYHLHNFNPWCIIYLFLNSWHAGSTHCSQIVGFNHSLFTCPSICR